MEKKDFEDSYEDNYGQREMCLVELVNGQPYECPTLTKHKRIKDAKKKMKSKVFCGSQKRV